jgi:hypothetical protein
MNPSPNLPPTTQPVAQDGDFNAAVIYLPVRNGAIYRQPVDNEWHTILPG